MRALSNKIGIDQSLLTKLLSGKRRFTDETSKKVYEFTGRPNVSIDLYTEANRLFDPIEDDVFFVLSDWIHFAIVELVQTKNFRPNPLLMAERLGVTEKEVLVAINRLVRVGYLKPMGRGWQVLKPDSTWVNYKATTVARKQYQKSILQKALDAMDDVPFELRDTSSLTVGIDKSKLSEVRKLIKEFRAKLNSHCAKSATDEVYQLSVSFFPLTKNLKSKE